MNAVSRERLPPAAAAGAVVLTCLRAPAVHTMALFRSHPEGVYRVPRILHASRPQTSLEAGGHLRRRQHLFPHLPAL